MAARQSGVRSESLVHSPELIARAGCIASLPSLRAVSACLKRRPSASLNLTGTSSCRSNFVPRAGLVEAIESLARSSAINGWGWPSKQEAAAFSSGVEYFTKCRKLTLIKICEGHALLVGASSSSFDLGLWE